MDGVLTRLSIVEILGVIAPGCAALAALRAWGVWDVSTILSPGFSSNSLVLVTVALIAAYAVGLLLQECVNGGTRCFLHLNLERLAQRANPRALKRPLWKRIAWILAGFLSWMPMPRFRRSFVEAQLVMAQFNETRSHIREVSRTSSPWDRLDVFRKLSAGTSDSGANAVLSAAAEVHGRLMFVLSLSLLLTLSAGAETIQCVVIAARAHHVPMLAVVAGLASAGSFGLRLTAARCWETEIMLLSSVAEWDEPTVPQ